MDTRDTSILTQVAFKEAGEQARAMGLDLREDEGQAQFERVFSYITESLFLAVKTQLGGDDKAGELVRGAFPGTVQVQPQWQPEAAGGYTPHPQPQWQPQPVAEGYGVAPKVPPGTYGPHNYQLVAKNEQLGPFPQWLYDEAAEFNVHEVWDNRGSDPAKRQPIFKGTGGRDAHAFWGPGNKR